MTFSFEMPKGPNQDIQKAEEAPSVDTSKNILPKGSKEDIALIKELELTTGPSISLDNPSTTDGSQLDKPLTLPKLDPENKFTDLSGKEN